MLRIGIDLGGTKTEGVVIDDAGKLLLRHRQPTPAGRGYDAVLLGVRALVGSLEQKIGAACRVGIATPGAISTRTGDLKNSNTLCLNDKPIVTDFEKILNRPIRIANDANCFALSEALDGAARGAGVVFGVILGTGVGGGIVVSGALHAGVQHIAGEWGHNVLESDGPPCYCGKRGCVETLLSGPGLARDYATNGGETGLSAKTIAALAATGDPPAEAAIQRYLQRFGRALAVVINVLDPDVVVLGGGLSNIQRLYTEGCAHVAHHVFNDELRTAIVRNVHGDSSGVRGAAQLWPTGVAA